MQEQYKNIFLCIKCGFVGVTNEYFSQDAWKKVSKIDLSQYHRYVRGEEMLITIQLVKEFQYLMQPEVELSKACIHNSLFTITTT